MGSLCLFAAYTEKTDVDTTEEVYDCILCIFVYAILDIASFQIELECEEKESGDNETFVEVC